MALFFTPEQRIKGVDNFHQTVGIKGLTRRDFMKGMIAGGAALPIGAAMYFGYQKLQGNPVKVGLIGAGDEGGVLVGEHNPDYLQFVAVADIRPSNLNRIFKGEPTGPRKGFDHVYGSQAHSQVKVYQDYHELLDQKDIEAVVIALPLFLHAPVAIEAMKKGKHVLCEKLMAWNINQCKEMIHAADENDRILAIGHQRHYSMLYAHASEVIKSGELGDIKHIRALWHRNNSWPKLDSNGKEMVDASGQPLLRDGWRPDILEEDRQVLESKIRQLGYENMEELVRWRLFNRTGGGLMAELGSHQLDACSIFLGKVHPLAVSGVGGKFFYHDNREVDDNVFVTFEFPGKNYFTDETRKQIKDKNDIVVVTYSSVSTNSFEAYGECVMGSRATMIVEKEESALLFPERNPNGAAAKAATSVTVSAGGGGKPAVESSSSTGQVDVANAQAKGADSLGKGPISRGYREEMEHFAYCIKMWNEGKSKEDRPLPRCHGRVAMADAIIALTSNLAMKRHQRIEFNEKWFDAAAADVPDPEMKPKIITT
ncbi:MAG: Gfo/Idh/MocA family protein [Gemmataceae bacterium]